MKGWEGSQTKNRRHIARRFLLQEHHVPAVGERSRDRDVSDTRYPGVRKSDTRVEIWD